LFVAVILVCSVDSSWAFQETRSVEGLLYDLKHPDAKQRQEAARLIGENRIREAVPALIEAAGDADTEVRYQVAKALFEVNDPRALKTYIAFTKDVDKRIQRIGIEGIVGIYVIQPEGFTEDLKKLVDLMNPLSQGYNPLLVEPYQPVSDEAVVAIADLLFSSDKGLRKGAASALGILRGKAALPAIQDALDRETDDRIKVELIWTIQKIGDPAAGEALIPYIRDGNKLVHDEAILALGRLRVSEAVPQLNELYRVGIEERQKVFGIVPVSGKDDLQKKVLEALSYIGDRRSIDLFEDALEDERDFYRRFGAEGLGRCGDRAYAGLLARKYLRENSKPVKLALGFALFRLGREEHIVELVDASTSDQGHSYLLELTAEEVRMLYPYVQSERDDVKIQLLDAIGMKGEAAALDVVQGFVGHENVDVASAANLAIRRLSGRFPQG
jgi:HEAT repeat protein